MSPAQKALRKLLKRWDLDATTLSARANREYSDAPAWFSLSARERTLLERGINTPKGRVRYRFDGLEIQVTNE